MEIENEKIKDKSPLIVFDNDGVLRDSSQSYERCIKETVKLFSKKGEPDSEELVSSLKQSNNDWERTQRILKKRGIYIDIDTIIKNFQNMYLGKNRDFTGYINEEQWLINNEFLDRLSKKATLTIVSGAPKEEIVYTLRKNNAEKYFQFVLGMNECENKPEGIKSILKKVGFREIYFCDDRPSPIKDLNDSSIVLSNYGIIPPKFNKEWISVLKQAGALKVFNSVNHYCEFLIEEIK